jgi:hypothetical protein
LAEVLQPLVGLGLQLQAIGGLSQEAEISRRLEGAMDDLDTVLQGLQAGLPGPTVGERRLLVPQGPPGDSSPIGDDERPTGGTAG